MYEEKSHELNVGAFLERVHKYSEIKELTPEIINEFVDKVVVHRREQIDSQTVQKLEIYYKMVGTDGEVIEKAKKNKLRGWSFGFESVKEHAETARENLKRRFIDEMNLFEVSIIDEQKVPCYEGTSIETRAEKQIKTEYRGQEFKPKIIDNSKKEFPIDYSKYEKILEEMLSYGTEIFD